MSEYDPRFTLEELVEASSVSARTIRYYIEEGILPRARGRGRASYYTTRHIEALSRITRLKEQGLSLDEIRDELRAGQNQAGPPAVAWDHLTLQPDLVIQVRSDASEQTRIFVRRLNQLASEWFDAPAEQTMSSSANLLDSAMPAPNQFREQER